MVATAFCGRGHRLLLFKRDDGVWETQKQKQKRMEVTLICRGCDRSFTVAAEPWSERNERIYCDECRKRNMKTCKAKNNAAYQQKVRNRENSKRSPWRVFGKALMR